MPIETIVQWQGGISADIAPGSPLLYSIWTTIYFNHPEPRLARFRWMAPLWRLLKPMRIFRFQLGFAGM